jgi:lysophospholipase L1-like esterase
MTHRSIIAIVGVVMLVTFTGAQTPYDSLYLKNPLYKHWTGLFALSKADSAEIVFLGNSITAGGQWNELLGRDRVVNRGIGSDNTVGMMHRMGSVYGLHPKLCFIMAGINDLYADASPDRIVRNYSSIIDTLKRHNIVPVIQSTLHVNPRWKRAAEKNKEVEELNRRLRGLAEANGIEFIDVNAVLSSGGVLRDECTTDGVHLTPEGYSRWRDLLLPVLMNHGL